MEIMIFWLCVFLAFVGLFGLFAFSYPFAAFLQHGTKTEFWPPSVTRPIAWASALLHGDVSTLFAKFREVALQLSDDFPNHGWAWSVLIAYWPLLGIALYVDRKKEPMRHHSQIFGNARFADASEKAKLAKGLELGIDPDTGKPVRVRVEGTLLTIGAPRTGKTSGLIIPNLAFPESTAFAGPAVVIDPKGEVHRAVAERRKALGRRVIHVAPLESNSDIWNPIATFDPDNILAMQQVARLILPKSEKSDGSEEYFRGRAAVLITAAILLTFRTKDQSITQAHHYISDREEFAAALKELLREKKEPIARDALQLLSADAKTLDPILSTAQRGFEWLADPRMRRAVGASTFDMQEVANGEADLFITIPTEFQEILASFTRWLLADLVGCIRRRDPQRRPRIVLYLDEAAALGRFEIIETAAAELPGLGLSLWTYWQDRAQLRKLYGVDGAAMLLRSAEYVTISDISAADPEEAKYWSDALGTYTGLAETQQESQRSGAKSASTTANQVHLMTPDALVKMPASQLIVLPHSKRMTNHPIKLRKTISHKDVRFRTLIADVPPVGETE